MPPRLYARDALVQALVPRLVGLSGERQQALRQEHPDDLPVVLLTGLHGMGKTAVLDALGVAYQGRLPLGRTDFAEAHRGVTTMDGVSNTSAVVDALDQLLQGLGPAVPGYGRLRFGRLLPGLVAVSSWHQGNEVERGLARNRIARLLVACGVPKADEVADWIAEISRELSHLGPGSDLEAVAELVVRQYFQRYTGSRAGRAVRDWYQRRVEGTDDGAEALVRLCLRFHRGGDFRNAAERVLMDAFLADLSDSFSGWKRLNRTPRPLVLLDDTHTVAGRRFLDLLLDLRAEPARDRFDPLVVVAARLGPAADVYPHARHTTLAEVATATEWSRDVQGSASAGLLTLALPRLGREDLLAMLDHTTRALHPQLPSALHRLTRGHPLGSSLLCEAVIQFAAHRPVEPEQLLDLRTAEDRPVTERLLEELIPPPQLRDHLVQLAPARDREAGQALAGGSQRRGSEFLATVARYLEEELWGSADDRPFIADPFLRTLLLHELRRGSDPARTAGRRWRETHELLRDHHAEQGDLDEPDVLRHTLACGDADAVVDGLTLSRGEADQVLVGLAGRFEAWEAPRWLDALQYVASAPHPPDDRWHDRCREIARGDHDRLQPDSSEVRRSVNRLLHALWYLADEVTEPDSELCNDLGSELAFLAMWHPSGHAELNRAAREWPVAARGKAPHYPTASSR